MKDTQSYSRGFTFVELLIVIGIISILSSLIFPAVRNVREDALFSKAKLELRSVEEAVAFYFSDNGVYPPDANREVPPGLEQYLAPGIWPGSAWPGSVLDWENWDDPDNPGEKIYQISIRFCPIGEPDECQFPNQAWAEDFEINSAAYWCISGACRSHINEPLTYPGYCINCNEE